MVSLLEIETMVVVMKEGGLIRLSFKMSSGACLQLVTKEHINALKYKKKNKK